MHMISKKDLSDAEMDTLTKSCSPTIVITANGEVQTHEEAKVYVKELDVFCPSGRMSRWPCKDYLKGTCTSSFCEKWHPPECLFYRTKSGCRFGEKCSYAHRQVDEQPSKRSKKNDDKSAVAMLKKNDWRENVWQPVVNLDKSHDRSGRPDIKRDTPVMS